MAGHLLDESARGVFIIAATPFADNGTLDLKSLERLIGFYIDAGVHGITLLGMMGEAQKLTYDEARLVIQATLRQVAGEVPVVVGVSSPGLATLAALTSDAMSLGAAAVMVAPPAGLATDEQIEGYVHQLCQRDRRGRAAGAAGLPQATGVHLSVARAQPADRRPAADQGPEARGLPGARQALAPARRAPRATAAGGSRSWSATAGSTTRSSSARGADGAMTGFAYPELLVEVYERFAAGREDDAFDLYDAYLPLIRYEQQPGIGLAIRKEILHRRGVLACPALRPPGARLDATDHAELDQLLARLERRVAAGL